jgi:hypothetical protein
MAHSNREKQSEERKKHKESLRQERAEKVKKKTVWELMADERAGIVQPKDGEEDDGKKKFRIRTRKVKAENRRSHRHGHGHQSNKVCVRNLDGSVVYVIRQNAEVLVAKGAAYTNKMAWREAMAAARE